MSKLDKPIEKCQAVLWRTVKKDGARWTLIVHIDPKELERIVADKIEDGQNVLFHEGLATIELMRQL